KKKQDERKQRWKRQAQQELAEELITVIDNLERAILTADEDSSLVSGVKMVNDQLLETLEKRGLERIDAEGEEFDPELHNAVETREHEEERKVLEQKKPGYRHHEKVLRPAEVVVSEAKETGEEPDAENNNSNNDTTGDS
ncbi:MAG: nucleotide exchange factor GrpE, partial [Candidatus Nanohaloarchaea archaeon]